MAAKHIEDEVRRRIAEWFAAAGLGENRVATEILYWLPQEFMDSYRELFHRALELGDRSKGSGGGGDENVVAQIKGGIGAKGSKKGERGTHGSMRATGGKRYVLGAYVVKDETALEIKRRVDRKLMGLVQAMRAKVMEELGEVNRERFGTGRIPGGFGMDRISRGNPRERSQGSIPGETNGRLLAMRGQPGKRVCQDCGRIAGRDWVRCPFLHA